MNQQNNSNNKGSNNHNISIMASYTKGLGERFRKTYNSLGIQVHFKGNNTIRTLLMTPRTKITSTRKSGVIFRLECPHINCQGDI